MQLLAAVTAASGPCHSHISSDVSAVQASRSFLTVLASNLPPSKKRKRESVHRDTDVKDATIPAAADADAARCQPVSDAVTTRAAGPLTTAANGLCSAVTSAPCVPCPPLAEATVPCAFPPDIPTASSPANDSPKASPYQKEHYQVSLAQMQAANYPLPVLSEDGNPILPEGFVAAAVSGHTHKLPAMLLCLCLSSRSFPTLHTISVDCFKRP